MRRPATRTRISRLPATVPWRTKHSAAPGDNAPSSDENKTNGNFLGASVQSGDPIRLSEASSDENDENENCATTNDWEGKLVYRRRRSLRSNLMLPRSQRPTGLKLNTTEHNWLLHTTDPDSPVGFRRKHDHSAAGDVIRLSIPSDWTQLKMPTDQRVFRQSQNSENFRTGWV